MAGYLLVALALATHALQRIPAAPRRGEYLQGAERFVMASVAMLASIAWVLVLPLFALGWLGSPRRRALGARLARFSEDVRARLPLVRRRVRNPVH